MKWYFASRTRHRDFISKLVNFLESENHSVVYDWSKESPEPYQKNSDKSSEVANDISEKLKDVDIFVLISDEAGTDMFIELGIIIREWMQNKKIKIYIVGKFNDRSLMHYHPAIKRLKKMKDVFSIECPDILNNKELSNLIDLFDY